MKKMNEDQLKKLDALTAKYANGGSPTAYVNSAAQLVGQVRVFALHRNPACHWPCRAPLSPSVYEYPPSLSVVVSLRPAKIFRAVMFGS